MLYLSGSTRVLGSPHTKPIHKVRISVLHADTGRTIGLFSYAAMYNVTQYLSLHIRVDMNKYPNLAKVPWYQAILEEGDCLYVPYLWLHHVRFLVCLMTMIYYLVMMSSFFRYRPLVGTWVLMYGGHHFSKSVYCSSHGHSFSSLNFRFNVEDCTNEEELPDFSPLGDFSLHPELQVK